MANHYYIISEVQFFNDKDDKKTWEFISGTGIDLSQNCSSSMPTLSEIKKALTDFGLETKEILNQSNRIELSAIQDKNSGLWLIFTDIKDDCTGLSMFEVGRGSDPELIIDFIRFLGKTHGNFLYYCDGGSRSLITMDEEKDKIKKEIYYG